MFRDFVASIVWPRNTATTRSLGWPEHDGRKLRSFRPAIPPPEGRMAGPKARSRLWLGAEVVERPGQAAGALSEQLGCGHRVRQAQRRPVGLGTEERLTGHKGDVVLHRGAEQVVGVVARGDLGPQEHAAFRAVEHETTVELLGETVGERAHAAAVN